jgi:hypothetical protein
MKASAARVEIGIDKRICIEFGCGRGTDFQVRFDRWQNERFKFLP